MQKMTHPAALDGTTLTNTTLDGLTLARTVCDLHADDYDALRGLDAHLDTTPGTQTVGERLCAALTGDVSNKPWAAVHRHAGSVNAVLTDTDLIDTVARSLAADEMVMAVRSVPEGVAAVAAVAGNSLKGFEGEDALAAKGGWTVGTMADEDNKIDLWAADDSVQVKVNGGSDKRWENHASHAHVDFLVVIDAATGGVGVNPCDPDFDGTAAYIKARDAGQ